MLVSLCPRITVCACSKPKRKFGDGTRVSPWTPLMPRPRASFSSARLRTAPVIFIAGALLCAGSGSFRVGTLGGSPRVGFAFISPAYAGENDDGWQRRSRNGENNEGRGGHRDDGPGPASGGGSNGGSGGGSNGGANGGSGGGAPNTSGHGEGAQPEGHHSSVSYDANRNMVKWNLKLGAGERHERARSIMHEQHQHESRAWTIGRGRHSDEAKEFNRVSLHEPAQDGWKEGHSVQALDKSINPVAARYRSWKFDRSPATTTVEKTRLPIGGLSYAPNEVLAIGLDQPSIERAEALGFKADRSFVSDSSDHTIVRFTVPPGLDAVRGQDLLSNELPGQRFELNRLYHLYRASARDEPVTLEKSPTPAPGDGSECATNTCFAREEIGWKDTLAPCARGLKVGVIDTDIDQSHPAFAGRNIHRFDFAPEGRRLAPNWHGTAVLSLLAGSPQANTPGLIPEAEFFSANVFFSDELGEMTADTISLLKALDWMKAFGVGLINMSFAGPRDGLVADAIERMSANGVVFVAAAGNEGPTAPPAYPAAYPQVIAVTAVTRDRRNYRYANRGDHIDVAAPGVDIWTAAPGARGAFHSGTSFAAPHVTAVLAVEPPDVLKQEKADLLDGLPVLDLGEQGRDPVYGRGLLQAPSECTAPPDAVASAAD